MYASVLLQQKEVPMRVACSITIFEKDRTTLERWSRGRSTPARLVMRATIVLKAATGMNNKGIAEEVGTDRLTVARWRKRFMEKGLAGIEKDLKAVVFN